MTPRRVSDNNVVGTAEEITSDIVLPDSRIPSTPEIGSESNAGDLSTEWNIDEQDDLFEGVFNDTWDATGWDSEEGTGTKTLTLGDTSKEFLLLKDYPQTPEQFPIIKLSEDYNRTNNTEIAKIDWSFYAQYDGSSKTYQIVETPNTIMNKSSFLIIVSILFVTVGLVFFKYTKKNNQYK